MLKITEIEQRATFFRELATMVQAGMTIAEGLEAMQDRIQMMRLRMAAIEGAKQTRAGKPFSEIMARYLDVFTPVEVAILRAGEESGRLDRMLDQLATYLENEYGLRQMMSRETFYPKLLFAFIIVFPVIMRTLLAYFGPGGSFLKALAALILGLLKLGVIAAVALGLYYLIRYLILSNPQLHRALDSLKLNLPVFGTTVRRLALARFSRGLAVLYGAGVSLSASVDLAADLTGNEALRQPMKESVPKLLSGQGLTAVLSQIPNMDNMALRMLKTGEQTGNIDDMMQRVAEHFEEAATSSMRRTAVVIPIIAVLIAGIIVAVMLIGFYGGYAARYGL